MFTSATEKQEIRLVSDGKTEVKITPGRSLGTFKELKIAVVPGKYRISGRKAGHREKVEKISVAVGDKPVTVTVIADTKF